jgi:hypothetical protein
MRGLFEFRSFLRSKGELSLAPATILLSATTMPVESLSSSKEYQRAFSLAVYILKDVNEAKLIASRVAQSHATELKKLIKNRKVKKHPNWVRVIPNAEFNLDIHTYIKSLTPERRQESEYWDNKRMLGDEDLIIRFIKQLVFDGLLRNSRFLNVGLAHLVFSYKYEDVSHIQLLLEQSPDNLPDDYKYRKHRGALVESLRTRFNGGAPSERQFLKFEPFKQHEEAVITSRDNSAEYYMLVRQCLKTFTPSAPPCPEPLHRLDPCKDLWSPFFFDQQAKGDEDEHAIERNRMHAVICPDCFSRILSALNFVSPESNLSLPLFSLRDSGGGIGQDRNLSSSPTGQPTGRNAETGEWTERKTQRSENSVPNQIIISVDDQPRAYIDLKKPQSVALNLEPGAAIIEAIEGAGPESVPRGLIYLDWDPACDQESPAQYKLKLNGNCTLEFLISYEMDSDGDEESAMVMVNCVSAAMSHGAST